MLISSAIRSRTVALGVGFLLNSSSSVPSWSWVARCLFWFFCCWVRVLFRGGRLELFVVVEPDGDKFCLVVEGEADACDDPDAGTWLGDMEARAPAGAELARVTGCSTSVAISKFGDPDILRLPDEI